MNFLERALAAIRATDDPEPRPMTRADKVRAMTDEELAAAAEKNLSYAAIAEIMNVTENTARNWLSMRTVMPGDAVLRAISHIMEGYQC